jgi:HSP20 family molecular chaperone IbpA
MAQRPFDKMTGLAALSEISRRLGGIGGQVKDAIIESQMRSASGQTADHTREQRFTVNTAKGPVEGVSQMSFRVGSLSDREPMGRGNRTPSSGGMAARAEHARKAAPDLDGAREPMVDCFDEGDTVVITAELPGVLAGDVVVTLDGETLLIETTGARRYRTRQPLPVAVEPASLTHALRNGILEARVTKLGAAA